MSGLVELRSVTKRYGGRAVLDRLSFSFPGDAVTLVSGGSGAGKTTLLHIVLGLVRPDAGRVEGVQGRRLAAVFQEDRLCENFSALQNIRLAAPQAGEDEVADHLEQVGLAGTCGQRVREMSGGMKRRVAIVRAVICRADILVLDEPLRGLDAATKARVLDYLTAGVRGRTVLAVTHDREEAGALGARARLAL